MIGRRKFVKAIGAVLAGPLLPFSIAAHASSERSIRQSGRYPGMEPDAPWRKEALLRIEQIRKADFEVQVVGSDGRPMAGVPVRLSLERHHFGFGGAVQPKHLFELGDADRQAFYRDVTSRYFHRVTISNGLKWKHHAAQKHVVEPFLDWCLEQHLPVRGHCLVWGRFRRIPDELGHLRYDRAALREAIEKHVTEFASMYDEPLIEWDVLNEPYTDHEFMDLLGNEAVYDWFRLAQEANPRLVHYINDYGVLTRPSPRHQDFYFDYIRDLLERRVLPDLNMLVDTAMFVQLDERLSQPAAGSLVNLLVDERGAGAVRSLYSDLAGRPDAAVLFLESAMGDSLAAIEDRWHEYLTVHDDTRGAAPPDAE